MGRFGGGGVEGWQKEEKGRLFSRREERVGAGLTVIMTNCTVPSSASRFVESLLFRLHASFSITVS